jgi:hypothetical protein
VVTQREWKSERYSCIKRARGEEDKVTLSEDIAVRYFFSFEDIASDYLKYRQHSHNLLCLRSVGFN